MALHRVNQNTNTRDILEKVSRISFNFLKGYDMATFSLTVLVLLSISLSIPIVGCTSEQSTAPTLESGKGKDMVGRITSVERIKATKHFPSHARDCVYPAKNCHNEKPAGGPPWYTAQIANLEAAIANNAQVAFFSNTSNFSYIWTSESTQELQDLQTGVAKLVIVPASDTTTRIYASMNASTGEAMDYSGQ